MSTLGDIMSTSGVGGVRVGRGHHDECGGIP